MRLTFLRWPGATLTLNAGARKPEDWARMRLRGSSSVLTNQPRHSCGPRSEASSTPARFPFDRGFATAELHHMGPDEGSSDFCLLRYCGNKSLPIALEHVIGETHRTRKSIRQCAASGDTPAFRGRADMPAAALIRRC